MSLNYPAIAIAVLPRWLKNIVCCSANIHAADLGRLTAFHQLPRFPTPPQRGRRGDAIAGADAKSPVAERTIQYRQDGGIDSAELDDGNPREVYWLGVIDVLQVRGVAAKE